MQQLDIMAKDISTTCSANNATEANTTNSEWNYINDLTDEDEAHYILEKIKKLREDVEDVTRNINKILETRNKLKKEGLMFYTEVTIKHLLLHVYKIIGKARHIEGYYTTSNGKHAIPHKEISKTKIFFLGYIDEELNELHTT